MLDLLDNGVNVLADAVQFPLAIRGSIFQLRV